MNCKRFDKLLNSYIQGDLPESDRLSMEKHALECETCHKELDFALSLKEDLASFPQMETSSDFLFKVKSRITTRKARPWYRSLLSPTMGKALAAGTLAVPVLIFFLIEQPFFNRELPHHSESPVISEKYSGEIIKDKEERKSIHKKTRTDNIPVTKDKNLSKNLLTDDSVKRDIPKENRSPRNNKIARAESTIGNFTVYQNTLFRSEPQQAAKPSIVSKSEQKRKKQASVQRFDRSADSLAGSSKVEETMDEQDKTRIAQRKSQEIEEKEVVTIIRKNGGVDLTVVRKEEGSLIRYTIHSSQQARLEEELEDSKNWLIPAKSRPRGMLKVELFLKN